MSKADKRYTSDTIDVTYNVKRCIHAAECVHGLPAVFDTQARPWVQPGNADADAVAAVVLRCPTGALHFERKDGGSAETAPSENRIQIATDGPLYVHGDVTLVDGDASHADTRVALCRCGASSNKPFCDNSHKDAGFSDAGAVEGATAGGNSAEDAAGGPLTVSQAPNGPLLLRGQFTLVSGDGETVFHGQKAALCRCGGSANKPFCDGTHSRIDFSSEESA